MHSYGAYYSDYRELIHGSICHVDVKTTSWLRKKYKIQCKHTLLARHYKLNSKNIARYKHTDSTKDKTRPINLQKEIHLDFLIVTLYIDFTILVYLMLSINL